LKFYLAEAAKPDLEFEDPGPQEKGVKEMQKGDHEGRPYKTYSPRKGEVVIFAASTRPRLGEKIR